MSMTFGAFLMALLMYSLGFYSFINNLHESISFNYLIHCHFLISYFLDRIKTSKSVLVSTFLRPMFLLHSPTVPSISR